MKEIYRTNKESKLQGKYVHLSHISPLLKLCSTVFDVQKIGHSFLKKPIFSVTLGTGPIKILMWTQMHGNEATATKVVCDLLKLFKNPDSPNSIKGILEKCTLKIIPILNPDGAEAYTRFNAQQIDLNRDAVNLEAIESQVLRNELERFQPDFCFNLHDQRNIYNVGHTKEPSSIAFLSPATEETRKLTPERIKAMGIIAKMYATLKQDIPKNLACYNDEFYPNATGDNFQKEGYTTILIEAGHFKDDYNREKVRYFYFKALITGLLSITNDDYGTVKEYENIPQNDKKYLDCIYNNVNLCQEGVYQNVSVGTIFIETVENNKLKKEIKIEKIGNLSTYGANNIYNLKGLKVPSVNEFFLLLSQSGY
jgi:zinc carboxypeptidase